MSKSPSNIIGSTGSRVLTVAGIAIGSLLMALAAQASVPVPFSPVPISGQTLALPLIVALLGTRAATGAMLLYLAEGAIGLPVFAHAGFMWATAGYLIAFPFAAWLTGVLFDRGMFALPLPRFAAILTGSMAVLAGGWAWLSFFTGPAAAFAAGVMPFLAGDLLKTLIATLAAPAFKKAGATLR
jgi:biotin transport system substrate-specific component